MLEQASGNHFPSRDLILSRAKSFITSQLSNPALDVTQVAEHCRVSTRYLHKVFESTEHTVASFIRESRLQRSREEIRNPALRNKLITDIASDWGIEEPAHFSRLYKARYGVSPCHLDRGGTVATVSHPHRIGDGGDTSGRGSRRDLPAFALHHD